jgi:cephalosporin-C deacetylase-like acetyl esterase
MLAVIFSFLFLGIVLGSIWFHDVRFPPEGRAYLRELRRNQIGSKDDTADQSKEQLVGAHTTAR